MMQHLNTEVHATPLGILWRLNTSLQRGGI